MSSATEVLLNIADTAITNTAKNTVVSFNPLEDDLFILLPNVNRLRYVYLPLYASAIFG